MKNIIIIFKKIQINKENIIAINLLQSFIMFVVAADFYLVRNDNYETFGHIVIPIDLCIIILLITSGTLLLTNIIFVNQFIRISEDKIYEKIEILKKQRHEFINHLESIRYFLNNEEYSEAHNYLDRIGINITTQSQLDKIKNSSIASIISNYIHKCESKGVFFEFNTNTNLGDLVMSPLHTTIIFNNLLTNALENCELGGIITFEIVENNTGFKFTISNSGKGIPLGLNIFKEGVSTKGEDRGYGLSNVKEILETYNGEIYIEEYDPPVFIVKINK